MIDPAIAVMQKAFQDADEAGCILQQCWEAAYKSVGIVDLEAKLKIAEEGIISCQLEFDRLRTQSGMYYAEKGLRICNETLSQIRGERSGG